MKRFDPILNGAFVMELPAFRDERGSFIKTFHDSTLLAHGIDFQLKESYYSTSEKDVIRGMHFQTPPHQHAKIVFCPYGAILDVIIDLRKSSPTYRQFFACELSADNHLAYYIPAGFAHGFKSLSAGAITYYLVSSEYSQEHDTGILYNSFGFDWGLTQPVISERDLSFLPLSDWESCF